MAFKDSKKRTESAFSNPIGIRGEISCLNPHSESVVRQPTTGIVSVGDCSGEPQRKRSRWRKNHVWTIASIRSEKRLPFGTAKIRQLVKEGKLKQHLPDNRTIFILESSIREYEGSPVVEGASRKSVVIRVSAMARVA